MTFKIDKEGNVLVEKVEGYGSSCLEVTRNLERALGSADESTRVIADEFNKPVEQDNRERASH